jgi:hypothetical protein
MEFRGHDGARPFEDQRRTHRGLKTFFVILTGEIALI